MNDDGDFGKQLLIIVLGVAGVAIQYAITSQSFRITLKARWNAMKADWREGYAGGTKVAEWFVREEAPKVIAEAEALTREGG